MATIASFARSPRLRLALLVLFALLALAGCSGTDGQAVDPLDPQFGQTAYNAVDGLDGWFWLAVALCALSMGASFLLQPIIPEWAKSYTLSARLAILMVFGCLVVYKWAMGNAKKELSGGIILPALDALQHLLTSLATTLAHQLTPLVAAFAHLIR